MFPTFQKSLPKQPRWMPPCSKSNSKSKKPCASTRIRLFPQNKNKLSYLRTAYWYSSKQAKTGKSETPCNRRSLFLVCFISLNRGKAKHALPEGKACLLKYYVYLSNHTPSYFTSTDVLTVFHFLLGKWSYFSKKTFTIDTPTFKTGYLYCRRNPAPANWPQQLTNS
mgnify:CR=1 FL=1